MFCVAIALGSKKPSHAHARASRPPPARPPSTRASRSPAAQRRPGWRGRGTPIHVSPPPPQIDCPWRSRSCRPTVDTSPAVPTDARPKASRRGSTARRAGARRTPRSGLADAGTITGGGPATTADGGPATVVVRLDSAASGSASGPRTKTNDPMTASERIPMPTPTQAGRGHRRQRQPTINQRPGPRGFPQGFARLGLERVRDGLGGDRRDTWAELDSRPRRTRGDHRGAGLASQTSVASPTWRASLRG